ncbi:MAG: DUF1848 domain-containing protein [Planctomycetota bacterium]
MNIISASRRTDIPARYGPWLMNRIRAGSASYRNPFGGTIHQVSLRPEEVIAWVFWTKNAKPFVPCLQELLACRYKACFQYTINGYGPVLEPGVPPAGRVIENFKKISALLGPSFTRWRYDPVVMGHGYDRDFHVKNFSRLAGRLEGHTRVCHTSFVQYYQKTVRHFDRLTQEQGLTVFDPEEHEKTGLAAELRDIASSHGIQLVSCCYPLLQEAGIEAGRCIDPELIRMLRPDLQNLSLKARPTREGCGCAESRDIGAYDTCLHGCVYCYATQKIETARRRAESHDPDSETLC